MLSLLLWVKFVNTRSIVLNALQCNDHAIDSTSIMFKEDHSEWIKLYACEYIGEMLSDCISNNI